MKAQRFRFTRKAIDALEPPKSGYELHWDADQPGFGIRITANNSRTYIVQKRLEDGRERRMKIARNASYTDLSPEEARKLAQSLIGDIAKGKDPVAVRREHVATVAAKGYTLSKLMQSYADDLRRRGKAKTAQDVEGAVKKHITEASPGIARMPARDVTSADIADLLRPLVQAGKKRRAAILRSYLVAAYNLALGADADPNSKESSSGLTAVDSNPAKGVKTIKGSTKARERVLSDAELKHFLAELDKQEGAARDAVKLALLAGGQRIQQVLRLEVGDVDDEGFIRLLDPKGKRDEVRKHFVPLAPRGKELAKELTKRAKAGETKLLFTSDGKKLLRLETISAFVAGIVTKLKEAEVCAEPFQARDLRRTAETRLAAMGISKDLRGQLLSHGISGVQDKHYDRHSYADEKRRILVAWENHLADVAAGKTGKGKKVVQLRGGKAA